MINRLWVGCLQSTILHFKEFQPLKGDIPQRQDGSLVSMEKEKAIPYSIDKLQDRGKFFVSLGEWIYEGQVIG